jgi:transposase
MHIQKIQRAEISNGRFNFSVVQSSLIVETMDEVVNLTDKEWSILEPLFPQPKVGGRLSMWSCRKIVDAIFSVVRSEGAWRVLPHHFQPRQTVYCYFRLWRKDGTWEHIHRALREQMREMKVRELIPVRRLASHKE